MSPMKLLMTTRPLILTILVLFNCFAYQQVEAHGTLVDPVSRNSLWRVDGSAPVNYNDIELFCGGIGVVAQNGNKCGLCGDAYNLKRPRPHETGGFMVVNRTVKNYFPGSTIDVIVNLDTNHGGYFEFELCQRDNVETPETEDCFKRLKFVDGSERFKLKSDHSDKGMKSMSLIIPEGLRECRACVLRWNYRAGNNWGICEDGRAATGCGLQELYRNCADISIGYGMFSLSAGEETLLSTKSTSLSSLLWLDESMNNLQIVKQQVLQEDEEKLSSP